MEQKRGNGSADLPNWDDRGRQKNLSVLKIFPDLSSPPLLHPWGSFMAAFSKDPNEDRATHPKQQRQQKPAPLLLLSPPFRLFFPVAASRELLPKEASQNDPVLGRPSSPPLVPLIPYPPMEFPTHSFAPILSLSLPPLLPQLL